VVGKNRIKTEEIKVVSSTLTKVKQYNGGPGPHCCVPEDRMSHGVTKQIRENETKIFIGGTCEGHREGQGDEAPGFEWRSNQAYWKVTKTGEKGASSYLGVKEGGG